jgi:bifunctional UDP-N-acetylglucosamine pyrophosphorylase/glucosamine-1-phosphate N-acetyltransferase
MNNIQQQTASIVMAAGRGSRMQGYSGNKTLLPLDPDGDPFHGSIPILSHILVHLPPGPKALVVHHRAKEVQGATGADRLSYFRQPLLNGTGGAILAARSFVESTPCEQVLITMGDVPFISMETYQRLVSSLATATMTVLGFCPDDRKQYGLLETAGARVERITEWKYWRDYDPHRLQGLKVCNAGIYAVRKKALPHYLSLLAQRPQTVIKTIDGVETAIEEYFITDLVEYMNADGLLVEWVETTHPDEAMGVDDVQSLRKAQSLYAARYR